MCLKYLPRIFLSLVMGLFSFILVSCRQNIGDGGPATNAYLSRPVCLKLDKAGNLYVADAVQNRIRRIDSNTKIITTIAGADRIGYAGDGGPANLARLAAPFGIAISEAGDVFIADAGNRRIRKVNNTGIITTILDGSNITYNQDATGNNIFFGYPKHIVLDATGNLFIADSGAHRVLKIELVTGATSIVAGCGQPKFSGDGGLAIDACLGSPEDIELDKSGNLYIADSRNNRIRRVDAKTSVITTVAGDGYESGRYSGDGGPAINASLDNPTGLAIDQADNLYIADLHNGRIRRVDANTGTITTVAGCLSTRERSGDLPQGCGGSNLAVRTILFKPNDVELDLNGNIFFIEGGKIRRLDSSGVVTTVVGEKM